MIPIFSIRPFLLNDEPDNLGGGGTAEPASMATIFSEKLGMEPPAAPRAGDASSVAVEEVKKTESKAETWDVARYLQEKVPAGKDLFGDDAKRVDSWDKLRTLHAETIKALESESAEKMSLKQTHEAEMAALRESKPGSSATAKEKEAWALEVSALKEQHVKETADLRAKAAKADLLGNHAFRVEFEGKMAGILAAAQEVAKAAGVSEDIVKAAFGAKNEYDLAKVLKDVEDDTAADLLKEKARAYLAASRERDGALNSSDPVKELAKWQDYEKSFQGVLSANFTDTLKSSLLAAVPGVMEKMTKEDPFFATAAGKQAAREISARFEGGYDLSYDEVVAALAAARSAPVHRNMAVSLAKEVAELKGKLSRYEQGEPGALPEPGASGPQATGGMFAEMFRGRV